MSDPKPRRFVRPANDNGGRPFQVCVDLFIPQSPYQIEVEVIAELLASLPSPANDNEGEPS